MMMGRESLHGVSMVVGQLTPMLSRKLGRAVFDKTRLTGKYDISMEWAPDEAQTIQSPPDAPTTPPSDAAGASFFTAIQEQLGLKLESQKGPVQIVTVDHAEKPGEN
jgi:uncharacterized protein (TIGR03435 family)